MFPNVHTKIQPKMEIEVNSLVELYYNVLERFEVLSCKKIPKSALQQILSLLRNRLFYIAV